MNEQLMQQFIENQSKELDLYNKILQNQSKELDLQNKISDNLQFIKDKLDITKEEQKELDKANDKVKLEHKKEFEDLKALIKTLDNKSSLEKINSDVNLQLENVNNNLKSEISHSDKISFNTQYGNNLSYFLIIGLGLTFLIYLLYKFLKIFI